jgi:hypothetical protein
MSKAEGHEVGCLMASMSIQYQEPPLSSSQLDSLGIEDALQPLERKLVVCKAIWACGVLQFC